MDLPIDPKYFSTTLMDHFSDAIILADVSGELVCANKSAASLFGYNKPEDLVEKGTTFKFSLPLKKHDN